MIRKLFHSGILQTLALFFLTAALLFVLPRLMIDGDVVQLYDAEILGVTEDGRAELAAYGGNMYRVNVLYLDEKPVLGAQAQTLSYEECRFLVDPAALEGVTKIRVAKRIAGFAELRSYAIDVDLQNAQGD